MTRSIALVSMTVLFVSSSIAVAHQPTLSDGSAVDAESAIVFSDIGLSRVVYHEVTNEAPQLWIKFDIPAPQSVYFSLGLPLIDRLADFRPAFAVLGPGLPEVDFPFETPGGLGGLIFETDDGREPEVFHEPFSGTSSWILREEYVDLPEAGTYFVVAYVPSGETGKLWLAPGDREEFGLAEIFEANDLLDEVRSFHELSGSYCFLFPATLGLVLFVAMRFTRSSAMVISTRKP